MIRMDGSKIARVLTDPIDSLFHDSHSFFTLTLFSPLCFSFFQFHVACASCADVLYTCLFLLFLSLFVLAGNWLSAGLLLSVWIWAELREKNAVVVKVWPLRVYIRGFNWHAYRRGESFCMRTIEISDRVKRKILFRNFQSPGDLTFSLHNSLSNECQCSKKKNVVRFST